MKRIFVNTGNKGSVIKSTMMLSSKTMIDEDEYDIINNDTVHYDMIIHSNQDHADNHHS